MHGEASSQVFVENCERTANTKEGDQGCSVHICPVPNGPYTEKMFINTNPSVSMTGNSEVLRLTLRDYKITSSGSLRELIQLLSEDLTYQHQVAFHKPYSFVPSRSSGLFPAVALSSVFSSSF